MKSAYREVRFRADAPALGWPVAFGIATACNPDGVTRTTEFNHEACEGLRSELVLSGLVHFPVTGGSADFSHAEPGFGVVCSKSEILRLGRRYSQDAVFWIEEGLVHLLDCSCNDVEHLGFWSDLRVLS